jgi:hypothetical protein
VKVSTALYSPLPLKKEIFLAAISVKVRVNPTAIVWQPTMPNFRREVELYEIGNISW